MDKVPAVSVIVPMYNSEKYIAILLESVLVQTLKDFELIIVDDGSTDKSCEIIESYKPRFGNKLRLVHSPKNTGHPAEPRNRGLALSRGKYVFFMDSDDALTKTSLKEMYTAAEKYQAEIVYCKFVLISDGEGENFFNRVRGDIDKNDKKTEFLTESLDLRMQAWFKLLIKVEPWRKLILRDYLMESQVRFMPVFQDDSIWTLGLLCTAKKIVMIPAACYIYRILPNSFSKVGGDDNQTVKNIRRKMDRTIRAMQRIDDFLGTIDFFKKNPEYRYATINNFLMIDLNWLQTDCFNLPPHKVKEICQTEFAKELGKNNSVISQLFAHAITLTKELILARQKIVELSTKSKE